MVGRALVAAAPKLMKVLAVVGTAAMFMVGGGILSHGIAPLHHGIDDLARSAGALAGLVSLGLDVVVGLIGGALALVVVKLYSVVVVALKRDGQ
jgi:predicted DNA repair protein MutK